MECLSHICRYYAFDLIRRPCSVLLRIGTPELALALANRSAALFHLLDYARALVDIEEALDSGYPLDLRFKLLERKAKCLVALQRPTSETVAACRATLQSLADASLDAAKRDQLQRELTRMIEEVSVRQPTSAASKHVDGKHM